MGIINKEGALYFATGIDNSGLHRGKQEAMGILRGMTKEISMLDIGAGIGIGVSVALAKMSKEAFKFSQEYKSSMLEVSTISQEVARNLTAYSDRILGMTQTIPVMANDSAKALYQIVSAGHDGADGMKVLEVSSRAAVGGLTDAKTAADGVTTTLNAFGKSADQAEQVADEMFNTVKLGKTTFGELSVAVGRVAPMMSALEIDSKEMFSALASMTKQGLSTNEAVTYLRSAVSALSKEYGENIFQGKSMLQVFQDIRMETVNSGKDLSKVIKETEARLGLLSLTGDKFASVMKDYSSYTTDAVGATDRAYKTMMNDSKNQLILLKNNMIKTFIQPVGSSINEVVGKGAKLLNSMFGDSVQTKIIQSKKKVNELVTQLYDANIEEEKRLSILKELEQIAPSITAKINEEGLSIKTLTSALIEFNDVAAKKMSMQPLLDDVIKAREDIEEAYDDLSKLGAKAYSKIQEAQNHILSSGMNNHFKQQRIDMMAEIESSGLEISDKLNTIWSLRDQRFGFSQVYEESRKITNEQERALFIVKEVSKILKNNTSLDIDNKYRDIEAKQEILLSKEKDRLQRSMFLNLITPENLDDEIKKIEGLTDGQKNRLRIHFGIAESNNIEEVIRNMEKELNESWDNEPLEMGVAIKPETLDDLKLKLIDLKEELGKSTESDALGIQKQIDALELRIKNWGKSKPKELSTIIETKSIIGPVSEFSESYIEEVIQKYATIEEKRRAIISKYDNEIRALKRAGEEDNVRVAEEARNKELASLNNQTLQASNLWLELFGDISTYSQNTINKLIADTERYLNAFKGKSDKEIISMGFDPTAIKNMQQALTSLQNQARTNNPFQTLTKDSKSFLKALKEGDSKTMTESLKGISLSLNDIGDMAISAGDQLSQAFGGNGLNEDIKSVIEGLQSAGQLAAGIASGDIMSIVQGGVGLITTFAKLFNKKDDKEAQAQRRAEVLSQTQDLINSTLERRIELLKTVQGIELSILKNNTEQLLTNQKIALDNQMRNSSSFLQKKGKNNNKSLSDLGINTAEDAWKLFYGTDSDSIKLQQYVNDLLNNGGYKWENYDELKKIADAYGDIEEGIRNIKKAEQESVTGNTFENMMSGLDSIIMGEFSDISGSFEDMMKQSVVQGIKKGLAQSKQLEDWYDLFTQYSSDGTLTPDEVNELRSKYEDYVNKAQQQYDDALKALGITDASTQGQSASKGFETISQDTASELNGRFTAIQMMTEEANKVRLMMLDNERNLLNEATSCAGSLVALTDLAIIRNEHLYDIKENTKRLVKIEESLNKIKDNTSNL
ncbi:MAG: phage tail tape measure protein [Marinifilaceae bacterium]